MVYGIYLFLYSYSNHTVCFHLNTQYIGPKINASCCTAEHDLVTAVEGKVWEILAFLVIVIFYARIGYIKFKLKRKVI